MINIPVAVTHEASEEVDHTDAAPSENSINQSERSDFLFKLNHTVEVPKRPNSFENAPFLYNLD